MGRCVGLLSAEVHRSRRLPGSTVVIARRVAASTHPRVLNALVQELDKTARVEMRARRIRISIVSSSMSELNDAGALLAESGFVASSSPSVAKHTIVLDLQQDEEALLRRVRPSVRRALKVVDQLPLRIAPIHDLTLANRLRVINRASYARHGVFPPELPFSGFIESALHHPDAFSLIGLYRTDISGSESLIAFEFTTSDRQVAIAEHAGMEHIRLYGKNVPAGYATLWASIRWGIRTGASLFDLGGVALPGDRSYNTTGSITRFKKHFGGEVVSTFEREYEKSSNTLGARVMNSLEGIVSCIR